MTHNGHGTARWVSGIFGSIVAAVSIYYLTEGREPVSSVPATVPVPERRVGFRIVNQLGPNQVSEEVQVYVGGEPLTTLSVNQNYPEASANVSLPRPGEYAYTLIADGVFINEYGQTWREQARGDGTINVREDEVFALTVTPHGIRLSRPSAP
jgi:hypothetical protein